MGSSLRLSEAELAKLSPVRRREVEEILQQIKEGVEANPLLAYIPYAKQVGFHGAPERTRAFYGGNRTGKTTAGVADDLVQALPPEMVPEHLMAFKRYGKDEIFRGRVITPDLGHTMEAVIEKFRELTPRQAIRGNSWEDAFDRTKRVLRFKRGDLIDFMSFEQDPDKFGGVTRHRIHYDEEPNGPNSYKIWRDSRMRLIDTAGDEIFTMTPLMGLSWVYEMLWEKRYEPGIFVVQSSMYDNPYLAREEIDEATKDLTREELKAIREGEPVHFEGRFYDEFSDSFHVRPGPPPSDVKDWEIVCGIDPGRRTAVLWVGFDADNRAFVFDEIYTWDWLLEDITDEIKKRNERWQVKPTYVIDPAARVRAGPNMEQFQTEFTRLGVPAAEGQNARGPGILEIKRRLQHGQIFVSKDCRNLIWEFPRYRRKPDSDDEWEAVKRDDHLLDALRYAVMERTWTLPTKPRKRNNYNDNPLFEPRWRGPTPRDAPPLGVWS